MSAVKVHEIVASGMVAIIVVPLSSSASCYGGLSSVVVAAAVVSISKSSGSGTWENIFSIGRGCVCWSAAGFSSALIKLGFKVCWATNNWSN